MVRTTTLVIVFGVSVLFVASLKAQSTEGPPNPPFNNLSADYRFSDLIRQSDPTAFELMTYEGQRTRNIYDHRKGRDHNNRTFVFKVHYKDGSSFEMQVNSEFENSENAMIEAEKYAVDIGRVPELLRVHIGRVVINKGTPYLSANRNGSLFIYTGYATVLERGDLLEEVLLHERRAHLS